MPKVGMEEIRREQVIGAVLKCVASEGIDHVTLDKAAKGAGVSKGVVSYYFKNKENLLLESVKAFFDSYMDMANGNMPASSPEISAGEMLLIIGKVTLGLYPAEGDISCEENKRILLQIYSKLTISEKYREIVKDAYNHYYKAIIQVLEYGVDENEFTVNDVQSTAVALMALLDGLLIYSIIGFHGNADEQFSVYREQVEQL